jgi:hypothetical protein
MVTVVSRAGRPGAPGCSYLGAPVGYSVNPGGITLRDIFGQPQTFAFTILGA